jgi:preprotein translocase subunit SecF
MFGVVLVGTYTSVFIASPILIYLGVGTGRKEAVESPEQVGSTNVRFSARDA